MDRRRVIEYDDEMNDEFSLAQITPRAIDGSYVYIHTAWWKRLTHLFWYRIVAMPIAWMYTKLTFRHTVIGREKLRAVGDTGYFLYGNHTQDIGDAFMPNMMDIRRDKYVIVHPNNVSMPLLGRITPSLGALPLPDDMAAYRHFLEAIETRITQRAAIVVYPEAHIWPYYTGIRPFPDTSFHYPIKYGVPAFCFTNTYHKRKHGDGVRIVTYVDGPFYPDPALPERVRKRELRDRIHACMCERAGLSTVQKIRYIKREQQHG